MLKIKETHTGFTTDVIIGRFSFFITLSDEGIDFNIKDLVEQAMHFNYIVLQGDDNFQQRENIGKFIQKLFEKNPNTYVMLIQDGTVIPLGTSKIENILYICKVKLKKSNIDYDKRINIKSLNWYALANTFFVFNIDTRDDIDEVNMLVRDSNIIRSKVYLSIKDNINDILMIGKMYGFNVSINMKEMYTIENGKVYEEVL